MSQTLQLRPYQREAIDAVQAAWADGMQRPAVVLPTGAGKGHPLDTEVPTPDGLRKWGDLQPGDLVFGSNGRPTEVMDVYDRGVLPSYRVTFSDGSSVVTDAEHLWTVRDYAHRRTSKEVRTLSTTDLADLGLRYERSNRWAVPVSGTVTPDVELPVGPYTLGALIANGYLSHTSPVLTTPDEHVAERIRAEHDLSRQTVDETRWCPRFVIKGVQRHIRALGLCVASRDKFIPRQYLGAGTAQRIALLQGLMDNDGSSRDERRSVLYHTTSPQLAEDVRELVCSLGGTATVGSVERVQPGSGKAYESLTVRILMPSDVQAISTPRKIRSTGPRRTFEPRRTIVAVERVEDQEIRCIRVAAPDSLYQVTRHYIVTHNTVVFSRMAAEHIAEHGTRVVILVHRDELADQTLDKLKQTEPGLFTGKVKAAADNVAADVMVCSVQTLARETRFNRLLDSQKTCGPVGLVITDECFPAGTLVGGSPIESLKPGDVVPTWNEETGREETRPVRRVMRKRPAAMVRVTLADGTSFACTPNHPILTTRGWCPAGMLWKDAHVVSFTRSAAGGDDLHGVRGACGADAEGPQGLVPSERPGVLLGRLPGHLGAAGRITADGADESGARLGPDAPEQPDAQRGGPGADVRHAQAHWAPAAAAGRERFGSDGAAAQTCGVPGLGDRDGHSAEGRRDAVALPGGHRASVDAGRRGGGRGVPLLAGPPSLRPEEGRKAVGARVVGVQVLEPGREGTYGGVCPDGFVYNIEVDTTHTYLIGEGIVVHNCHHAAAISYRNILVGLGCYSGMPGTRAVGFTATLARGDGQGLGDVWEDAVYTRSPLWMMAKGHLVDIRSKLIDVDTLHLGDVKRSKGDYQAKDLGDAMMEAGGPQIIAKVLEEHAADRRSPIVFTPTVEVARATAEALPSAAYVHGGTPREERLNIYRRFRTGEVRTLVNCMVLTEGADFPFADCAVIARPTKSQPLFIQMLGRVLRPSPATDKRDALALILAGEGGSLCTLVDLEPGAQIRAVEDGETLAEAYEREESRKESKVPAGSLRFELRHRDIDLFKASAAYSWLRTNAGVQFIPLGDNGEILIWPSREETEKWDVAYAPPRGTWERLHEGLDLGMAMAWAETEATDRSSLNMTRTAAWRKKPASPKLVGLLRYAGHTVPEGIRAGLASDLFAVTIASRKLDRFVR